MLNRPNLIAAALLALGWCTQVAVAGEASPSPSMPAAPGLEVPREGAGQTPAVKATKGYGRKQCNAVYGKEDCAELERILRGCERRYGRQECDEFRQCIITNGYEHCQLS